MLVRSTEAWKSCACSMPSCSWMSSRTAGVHDPVTASVGTLGKYFLSTFSRCTSREH